MNLQEADIRATFAERLFRVSSGQFSSNYKNGSFGADSGRLPERIPKTQEPMSPLADSGRPVSPIQAKYEVS